MCELFAAASFTVSSAAMGLSSLYSLSEWSRLKRFCELADGFAERFLVLRTGAVQQFIEFVPGASGEAAAKIAGIPEKDFVAPAVCASGQCAAEAELQVRTPFKDGIHGAARIVAVLDRQTGEALFFQQ